MSNRLSEWLKDRRTYKELFEVKPSERKALSMKIKEAHKVIFDFRALNPLSGFAEEIQETAKKYCNGTEWPDNPFLLAEEFALYSGTARACEPSKLAALAMGDHTRVAAGGLPALGACNAHRAIKFDHPESYNPNLFVAYLTTTGAIKPEDLQKPKAHEIVLEKCSAVLRDFGVTPPWSLFYLGDYMNEENRPKGFQDFVDFYWKCIQEKNLESDRAYQEVNERYGTSKGYEQFQRFEMQRRRELRLVK